MRLRQTTIEHFMPYRERQTLPLTDLGLVLLKGDNRVSRALNSNGVGKTALFEAIGWGLFGETLRGYVGDEVACRFTKDPCIVSNEWTDGQGREWRVVRQRRPTKLVVTIDGVPIDAPSVELQAQIDSALGYGWHTYRSAILFGATRFMQAEQDDQLRMLDEVQGLDFADKLKRARVWQASTQARVEAIGTSVSQLQQQHQELIRQRETHERLAAEHTARMQSRLAESRATVKRLQQEVADAEREVKDAKARRDTAVRYRKVWTSIVKAHEAEEVVRRACESVEHEQTRALEVYERQLAMIQRATCPTCTRAITVKDREQITATLKAGHDALMQPLVARITHAQRAVEDAATKVKVARAFGPTLTIDVVLQAERDGSDRLVAQSETSWIFKRGALATAEREAEKTKQDERYPGQAVLDQILEQMPQVQQQMREQEREYERASRTGWVATYAVEAFGDRGVRSLMFDSIAPYLNQRMSEHLQWLAGGEASLVASAQRQLKKGTARERLTFLPSWAWGGEGLKAPSTGQDQRQHLALYAALQDLADVSSKLPFRAYDEPGDGLDTRGIECFVQWVQQQARDKGTAFLIAHRDDLVALVDPDEEWTVVLDDDGAHISRLRTRG
jgi:DNA repair exonuclease SbcCD ATPase subunit